MNRQLMNWIGMVGTTTAMVVKIVMNTASSMFPRTGIVAKEAEKNVAPRIFRLTIVPMSVNRDPINRLTTFIWAIGVALVMLDVNHVVVSLRKAARHRFDQGENSVEQLRAEKGVVNEVM
jgi:hypothetical protein